MGEVKKRSRRIMVVDDNLDLLSVFEVAGEIEETLITIQKGSLSALRMLHDLNYEVDAIIIDLSLPDMDGITLTKQIRQNENLRSKQHPIEIFWFTGWPYDENNSNDPIMLGAEDAKVTKIFSKPHDPVQIIHEVKEVLS